MKKHILVAAVAAAVVAPAMAQNASVYGRLDQALQFTNNGTSSGRFVGGSLVTSERLGFAATEDLGGGMKAFVKLEAGLNSDVGSFKDSSNASTAANASTAFFDRDQFVGISGGFGSVSIGNIEPQISKLGAGLNAVGTNYAHTTNGSTRTSNAVQYESPSFNGFKGFVQYKAAETTDGTSVGSSNELAVSYASGALAIAAASQTIKLSSSADTKIQGAGLTYNLGFATVGYNTSTYDADTSNATKVRNYAATVGVPMGNGLTLNAALVGYDSTAADADASGYVIGVHKALSKRTTVYGVYGGMDNDSGASYTIHKGAMTGVASQNNTVFAIGVAHTF